MIWGWWVSVANSVSAQFLFLGRQFVQIKTHLQLECIGEISAGRGSLDRWELGRAMKLTQFVPCRLSIGVCWWSTAELRWWWIIFWQGYVLFCHISWNLEIIFQLTEQKTTNSGIFLIYFRCLFLKIKFHREICYDSDWIENYI